MGFNADLMRERMAAKALTCGTLAAAIIRAGGKTTESGIRKVLDGRIAAPRLPLVQAIGRALGVRGNSSWWTEEQK